MDAPTFNATRFVRPALLSVIFYFFVVVNSSMMMVNPAHATGNVPVSISCSSYTLVNSQSRGEVVFSVPGFPTPGAACAYENFGLGSSFPNGSYSCASPYTFWWAVCAAVNSCPANSTGTPAINPTICTCDSGFKPDAAGTSCVSEQYTLTLTPESATIEPGKTYTFTATLTNQDGTPPAQPVPVSVKVDVDPTSGGHDHGEAYATRPKGSVSPASGNTALSITFTATEVSGTHKITATCDQCSNSPKTATVDVKVDGLHQITDDPSLYVLIGGEPDKKHHDNHYLTDDAKSQLVVLAINYHFLYPNELVLHLNDASLVWGGKFDINGNWVGDHGAHRRGTVIDVRANTASGNIPERLFTDFEKLADGTQKNLAGSSVSANAELHCSSGRDPSADNCVGDDNRHYHVILLGVDQ